MLVFVSFIWLYFFIVKFCGKKDDDIYFIWHNTPRLIKFTIFIKKSVEKNESISSKHGGFKKVFELVRKRLFEQNYNFWVIICFSFC